MAEAQQNASVGEQQNRAVKPYVIVVGVDFSEASALAMERAFAIASGERHAEVHVVNVVQTYGPQVMYELPADSSALTVLSLTEARARLRKYCDEQLQRFHEVNPGKSFDRAIAHVRFDATAEEIAQLAADLEADLVVVGTHGRRGISRLLIGSTAEAAVRLSPCPVLVVREKKLAENVPRIEPPCPQCVEARRESGGTETWCEQHRERHGQRHTYFQSDRVSGDREMPLFFR
jgi:nucleotide-binding universal stress UspA family protein